MLATSKGHSVDDEFDYKGTSQLWLCLGVASCIVASLFGSLILVASGLCFFVFTIICHSSHLGQQQANESLEIRKRLKAIEDRLDSESSPKSGG